MQPIETSSAAAAGFALDADFAQIACAGRPADLSPGDTHAKLVGSGHCSEQKGLLERGERWLADVGLTFRLTRQGTWTLLEAQLPNGCLP